MTARAWCFTLNSPEDGDIAPLAACALRKYICWGVERGETGNNHFQGYMEMVKPMRLSGLKKLQGPFARMHLEARRGTRVEARDYCKKGEQSHDEWLELGTEGPNYGANASFVEHGVWDQAQGHRSDLDKTRALALVDGLREVTTRCTLQQILVAEKFLTYNEEPRDEKPTVIWLWGPTGAGKSRMARELTEMDDTYVKSDGEKWWPGYDGHKSVIIDDFRDSWWCLTTTLSLLDRYEKRIEYKGGFRQFVATKIVVTSCSPPNLCYKGTKECVNQLLRRISLTLELRNPEGDPSRAPPAESSCNEVLLRSQEGNTTAPMVPTVPLLDFEKMLEELLS